MSDEQEKNSESAKPPATTPPAAATAAASAAAKPQEPPAPPQPGRVGNVLLEQGLSFTPLGNDARGFEMLEVPAEAWPGVAEILRDDVACRFDLLVSVSGVDWKTHRQAVYHLYSTETFQWLVVKVNAVTHGETERVPSVTPVWPAADWHERETYDLFGLHFDGHPNHQRILMPNDWLGHPLRKDYKEVDPRLVWNRR